MNTLSKKPTIKEIITENKIRSLICLSIVILSLIFIYKVIKASPNMSTELVIFQIGIGVWIIALAVLALLSPNRAQIEKYFSRKRSHEIHVDYLQRILRYGIFGTVVYVFYLFISAFFNWDIVFVNTYLGKQLYFIFHGESVSSLNLLVSKCLLSIYVLLKLASYFTVLFCASNFFKSLGSDFKKFTLEAAKYLKLVGFFLLVLFFTDIIFFTAGQWFDVKESFLWVPLLSLHETRADYFVLLFFFGASIYILSTLIARGVELEDEIASTI